MRTVGDHAKLLLMAAYPLHEPMVRQGTFVMNTHEEIIQAFSDHRHGLLGGNPEHISTEHSEL